MVEGPKSSRNFGASVRILAFPSKELGNMETGQQNDFHFKRITILTSLEILLLVLVPLGIYTLLGQLSSHYKGQTQLFYL